MDDGWRPTRDSNLILRLHRSRHRGLYELAGQYSHVRPGDLPPDRYSFWLHLTGGRVSGFAIATWTREATVCLELWCDCRGFAGETEVRWTRSDLQRLRDAYQLLRASGRRRHREVLLRTTVDNPFALLLARRYSLRPENSLLLATRRPGPLRVEPPAEGYRIRPYRPGDEGAYRSIHNASFREELSAEVFRRWVNSPRCKSFSATFRDHVVGFIIAEVRRGRKIGDFNLAVDELHRGRGLGTALLSAGLVSLHTRGVQRVVADHWAANSPAVSFYQKHGFIVEKTYHVLRVPESSRRDCLSAQFTGTEDL